jgi:oxygen-independent coproporphyrinogen-3 oxidase
VAEGSTAEAAGETLDAETRRVEGLQLSLRTRSGVPASALDVEALDGLVAVEGERAVLTRAGRLLANEIAVRLR